MGRSLRYYINILDILETKILGSNLIYTHHWKAGDMLVLNNPSLAHIAGPGSQGSAEVTGLRYSFFGKLNFS